MQKGEKRKLKVLQGKDSPIVEGISCFAVTSQYGINCQRKSCSHWIKHTACHNCVIIAAKEGPHTLQKIGQIYGLTRMRICQIEKGIYEKIRKIS